MVTSKLVIEEGVSFQGSCNTAKASAQPQPSQKQQNQGGNKKQEAQKVVDKVQQVEGELAKK